MNQLFSQRARRTVSGLAVAVALGAAAPAAADDATSGSSSVDCATQALSKPFLPWLDVANYTMPDGASFEDGTEGWRLGPGAAVVAGNEPYEVHAKGDSRSLRLPARSSALSTPICIGLGHPTLRLFARSSSFLPTSLLRVDVVFEDFAGRSRSLTVGAVTPTTRWQPSLPLPVVVNLLSVLPSGPAAVKLAFTPIGSATWWIDDVYVDPKARN